MATTSDKVLRKFARLREAASVRRTDYKGERRRINVRVGVDLALQLHLIKYASGEDKNSVVERLLRDWVTNRLKELEIQHGPQQWQAVVACAKAGWR